MSTSSSLKSFTLGLMFNHFFITMEGQKACIIKWNEEVCKYYQSKSKVSFKHVNLKILTSERFPLLAFIVWWVQILQQNPKTHLRILLDYGAQVLKYGISHWHLFGPIWQLVFKYEAIVTIPKIGINWMSMRRKIPIRTNQKRTENVWTSQQHIHNRNLLCWRKIILLVLTPRRNFLIIIKV